MAKIQKINDTEAKIFASPETLSLIYNHFAPFAKSFQFAPDFKMGKWDGKIKFFSKARQTIPLTLLEEAYSITSSIENVELCEECNKILNPKNKIFNISLPLKTPRDYQLNAINELLTHGNGMVRVATGGGKSIVIIALIKTIYENFKRQKAIIIVPSKNLVNQFFKDFKDTGWEGIKVDKLYGEDKSALISYDSDIVISTWQSLNSLSKLDKEKYREFIQQFGIIVIDEAHSCKAKALKSIVSDSTATLRFGFTATIPTNKADYYTVISSIGPIRVEEGAAKLQSKGYLADIFIRRMFINYKIKDEIILENGMAKFKRENKNIRSHVIRNTFIKNLSLTESKQDKNVLIFVENIDHGDLLYKLLPDSIYIHGKIKTTVRDKAIDYMENVNGKIMIATYGCFGVGVNITNIPRMILASSSKSDIRVIQAVGRGLRLHDDKDRLILYDIIDCEKYALDHAQERLMMYAGEGFKYKDYRMELE